MYNWSAKELRWFPCMSIAFTSCSCHTVISRVSNIIPFELTSAGLSELIHQTVFCLASFLLTLWTLNFLIELHVALVACGVWNVACVYPCLCVCWFSELINCEPERILWILLNTMRCIVELRITLTMMMMMMTSISLGLLLCPANHTAGHFTCL